MCGSKNYPYLSHWREFSLDPPPLWKFQSSFIHLLKFLSLWEPPTRQEFPIPSEGNTQSRNTFDYVKKRRNGRQNSQEALPVPFPLQWGRFLRVGDGSFQFVWWTDLEIDLERTENYCVELLALYRSTRNDYLNTVFSDVVILCRSLRNKRPSHGPDGKSFNL